MNCETCKHFKARDYSEFGECLRFLRYTVTLTEETDSCEEYKTRETD